MIDGLRDWIAQPLVAQAAIALAGIAVIVILSRLTRRSLSRYLRDPDTRHRARKFVTFLGYIVGVLFVVTVFSDRLGSLTVAFGVAGAGIAFALQEVIVSVAGWLAVSFGHFYGTGDRIQLGGIVGDVIDIGVLRTTVIECGEWIKGDSYSGRIVRIANSSVFKEPVFNYSADFPFLWDEITVPVKYGCSVRLARETLQRVAEEVVGSAAPEASAAWRRMVEQYVVHDERTDPMVTLVANDNWMEFTIRYVVDFRSRRATKDRLFTRILEEIESSAGRVAIASTTLQLVDLPAVEVRLGEKEPTPRCGSSDP
jgi:small-conductance mechanosensitive channel